MNNIVIESSTKELIIRLINESPKYIYDVTIISDLDINHRLYGVEIFLYEESKINIALLKKQFKGFENIEIYDDLLYLYLRKRDKSVKRGGGFGRRGFIGLTGQGLLCEIRISWEEPGSANPIINPSKALDGISSITNIPQ